MQVHQPTWEPDDPMERLTLKSTSSRHEFIVFNAINVQTMWWGVMNFLLCNNAAAKNIKQDMGRAGAARALTRKWTMTESVSP